MVLKPYIRIAQPAGWEIVDPPEYMEARKDATTGTSLVFRTRDAARQALGMAPGKKLSLPQLVEAIQRVSP